MIKKMGDRNRTLIGVVMNIKTFKREIEDHILDRGYDYWESGAVQKIAALGEDKYKAVVEGSENYTVTISLDKKGNIKHSCSCPYDYGPVCKHVVAVLYELAEGEVDNTRQEETASLESILKRLSIEELREIILEQTRRDLSWESELLARFSDSEEDSYSHYCDMLNERIDELRDQYDFIGYYQAQGAGEEASDMVESAKVLIGDEEYRQALPILHAVCTVMSNILEEADDSDGSIGGAIEEAVDCFREIAEIPDLPEESRNALFSLLTEQELLRSLSDYSWDSDLLSILPLLVKTDDEEKQLLSLLDEYSGAYPHTGSTFGRDYKAEKAACIKLSLYQRRRSAAEVDSYIRKQGHMPYFRKLLLQQQLDRGDFENLYREAEEGIMHDADYPGLVHEWMNWILKGAQTAGDTERVRAVTWKLLLDSRNGEIEMLEVLKTTVAAEQWPELRDRLFSEMAGVSFYDHRLIPFYIHEKLYDRLWAAVKERPAIDTFIRYAEYLLPRYAEEMAELSRELVQRRLISASNRQFYAEAALLLKLLKTNGAKQQAKAIAAAVLSRYTNRPAMRAEFRSAGF